MVGRYINNSYFPGMIDDVRVYDKALSSEEIGYLYALGGATPPPATPPVTPPGGETTPTQPTTPPADTQAPAVPGGLIPVAPPPTTPVITGPVSGIGCFIMRFTESCINFMIKFLFLIHTPAGTEKEFMEH
jgi:hypothetical protein